MGPERRPLGGGGADEIREGKRSGSTWEVRQVYLDWLSLAGVSG